MGVGKWTEKWRNQGGEAVEKVIWELIRDNVGWEVGENRHLNPHVKLAFRNFDVNFPAFPHWKILDIFFIHNFQKKN